MSHEAAEYECFVFTVGAQDTTAAFMSAFMDHILHDQHANSQLLNEIEDFE